MIDRQKIQDAVIKEVPLASWKTIGVTIDETFKVIKEELEKNNLEDCDAYFKCSKCGKRFPVEDILGD